MPMIGISFCLLYVGRHMPHKPHLVDGSRGSMGRGAQWVEGPNGSRGPMGQGAQLKMTFHWLALFSPLRAREIPPCGRGASLLNVVQLMLRSIGAKTVNHDLLIVSSQGEYILYLKFYE